MEEREDSRQQADGKGEAGDGVPEFLSTGRGGVAVRVHTLDYLKEYSQERVFGGPLFIFAPGNEACISDGLVNALAPFFDDFAGDQYELEFISDLAADSVDGEYHLEDFICELADAADDNDIDLAQMLLGPLGFLVWDAGNDPDVWAWVKENFGEEERWLDRILDESHPHGKIRARKTHNCALCPGNRTIRPSDTYHVYAVPGEGTVKVCAACVDKHDLSSGEPKPNILTDDINWRKII